MQVSVRSVAVLAVACVGLALAPSLARATSNNIDTANTSTPLVFAVGTVPQMTLSNTGLSIVTGLTTPALTVNGRATAGSFFYSSDMRLKKDIHPAQGLAMSVLPRVLPRAVC